MPSRESINYFGAGPARLPTQVLERAAQSLVNHANTGLGLVEHSHRSALSSNILKSASDSLKELLQIPAGYEVIFMQGGGTTQFSSVVYNLVSHWVEKRLRKYDGDIEKVRKDLDKLKCEYIVTGGWSSKASQEAARLLGDEKVSIAANAKKENGGKWGIIPDEKSWNLVDAADSALTYFCDNETVDGVEFPEFPKVLAGDEERLVVGDMSSNILSRPVDVSKYAVIFVSLTLNHSLYAHLTTSGWRAKKPRNNRHNPRHHPLINPHRPTHPRHPPRIGSTRPAHHDALPHPSRKRQPLQHPPHLRRLHRRRGPHPPPREWRRPRHHRRR